MDSNGARALALRIEQRRAAIPEPAPVARVVAADAAPIFRWFGIEPLDRAGERADDRLPIVGADAEPA